MFDYRLFYPQISIDEQRVRRPLNGHPAQRVYRLPDRRAVRQSARR